MNTIAPILMKGILAVSLVFGLAACSGSDFSGSNSRKSLGIGSGSDGEDHSGDTDAADVADTGDASDTGDNDDSDDSPGYDTDDGVDAPDGDIDADGDSGDTGDDIGSDDATDSPGGDAGLDGGEFNAKLRSPLTIKVISADEAVEFFVQYKKKDGTYSSERSIKFKEDEKTSKTIDGVCRNKDNGTGEMNIKLRIKNSEGDGGDVTGTAENARKSGGSGSMVKITADMDGCGAFGTCIDEGKDNTTEFSCPKFLMKIEGF